MPDAVATSPLTPPLPSPGSRKVTWPNRLFWIGMVGAWAVWVPNFLHIQTAPSEYSPLFIASPFLGALALGAAIYLRSWWRVPVALLLGVGASWTIIGGAFVLEALLR